MEALITRFGLLAVFLGTAVEGDLALIVGGVAAHMGLMDPLAVGVAGTFGGLFGDAVWYLVGRSNADAFRQSRVYRRVGPTIERLVARFGAWQILLARPVYGTRVASMLFWGTQRLPPARFVALDLPACAAWAVLLVSLGYFSSGSVAAVMGRVRHIEEWLGLALVVALSIAILAHFVMRRAAGGVRS